MESGACLRTSKTGVVGFYSSRHGVWAILPQFISVCWLLATQQCPPMPQDDHEWGGSPPRSPMSGKDPSMDDMPEVDYEDSDLEPPPLEPHPDDYCGVGQQAAQPVERQQGLQPALQRQRGGSTPVVYHPQTPVVRTWTSAAPFAPPAPHTPLGDPQWEAKLQAMDEFCNRHALEQRSIAAIRQLVHRTLGPEHASRVDAVTLPTDMYKELSEEAKGVLSTLRPAGSREKRAHDGRPPSNERKVWRLMHAMQMQAMYDAGYLVVNSLSFAPAAEQGGEGC